MRKKVGFTMDDDTIKHLKKLAEYYKKESHFKVSQSDVLIRLVNEKFNVIFGVDDNAID